MDVKAAEELKERIRSLEKCVVRLKRSYQKAKCYKKFKVYRDIKHEKNKKASELARLDRELTALQKELKKKKK